MRIPAFALSVATLLLAGCGGFAPGSPAPATAVLRGLHGSTFGGRQPIAGALVQIYSAGTTGYGTGATGLIAGGGVLSDATGSFTITGDYTCTAGQQMYLVATGGDSGSGTNAASALLAALGPCENLEPTTRITMNEVTTIGSVWALSAFMSTGFQVGAPATNLTGLTTAFADVNSLVNSTTGFATQSSAGVVVPSSTVYLLANILAACINSNGAGSSGCSTLFSNSTPPAGVAPSDTVTAALDIARNPGNNVANLSLLSLPVSPYSSNASVNDFTLGITYTTAALHSPSAVAVDSNGKVWMTNASSNTVSALAHDGSAAATYAAASLSAPSALAIDPTGNVWVTNSTANSVTVLTAAGSQASGSPYTGGGLSTPAAIAFDGSGNAWIANAGSNSATAFTSTGTAISGASGFASTGASAPVGVAVNPR